MKNNPIFALLLFVCSLSVQAQSSVLLLDGELTTLSQLSIKDSLVSGTNTKGKIREYMLYDVFSITDEQGNEQIHYQPKPGSNDFSIEQMRSYLQGEYDARTQYTNKKIIYIGAGVTVATFAGLKLAGISTFMAPLVPAVYTVIYSRRPRNIDGLDDKDEFYTQGYYKVAGEKHMKAALIGSGIGMAAGIALMFVL